MTTPLFDQPPPVHRRVLGQLDDDQIIWLASVRPDGRPHNVPIWFLWHDETVLILSEERTQKIRNLRHSGAVVLSLETGDAGEEVAFFDGTAEISPEPAAAWLPRIGERYAAKYADGLGRQGNTLEQMAVTYTQVIVVTPTKLTAW